MRDHERRRSGFARRHDLGRRAGLRADFSNRIFKSYDDLVDHCCAAWNELIDQPWRIMSIGLRQWAHGF